MKEPRRLVQSADASPVLRDALRALEKRGPSPEALARLRAGLPGVAPAASGGAGSGNAGDAAVSSGGSGGGLAAASGGAAAGVGASHTVLFVVATTAVLAVYGMNVMPGGQVSERAPAPASVHSRSSTPQTNGFAPMPDVPSSNAGASVGPTDSGEKLSVARGSGAARSQSSAAATGATGARVDREPSSVGTGARNTSRASSAHAAKDDPRSAGRGRAVADLQLAAAPIPDPREPQLEARTVPDIEARSETPQPLANAAMGPQPHAAAAEPRPAARPELAPEDEAGLLYRAKRSAARDPRAALRLLASHAKYFPQGTLAEERDVLKIQLHRKLGDAAVVQRLAAEFRARYPASMYLPSIGP